jgi:hypothetical protein
VLALERQCMAYECDEKGERGIKVQSKILEIRKREKRDMENARKERKSRGRQKKGLIIIFLNSKCGEIRKKKKKEKDRVTKYKYCIKWRKSSFGRGAGSDWIGLEKKGVQNQFIPCYTHIFIYPFSSADDLEIYPLL